MLRACGFKFMRAKLGKFVRMLNYAIPRKIAGDFDLDKMLDEFIDELEEVMDYV